LSEEEGRNSLMVTYQFKTGGIVRIGSSPANSWSFIHIHKYPSTQLKKGCFQGMAKQTLEQK